MIEKKLISKKKFAQRMLNYLLLCAMIILFSLALGVLGYHYFAGLSWLDSFYNTSMILTGMGPVDKLRTGTAKLFASFYALYSGIVFLTTVAIFVSPIAHRIMTKLHFKDFVD